jgi:hypothetical protein
VSAILAMTNDPRLYSKQPRIPVDVIAPQHVDIHADLERWGGWNRERYEAGTCASIEKRYDAGGREVKKAVVSLPTNPRNLQLDRAVRHMSMAVPQHYETIKLFYVTRRPPIVICRMVTVHWKDFGTWMFDCRAMVINVCKALG